MPIKRPGFLADGQGALMAVNPALDEALSRHFGFTAFRPGQKKVIEACLNGEDVLAVMPTGSGKSLCYQAPSLLLPGLTLVISPLVSLMKDQVDSLHAKEFTRATLLNSQISAAEAGARMRGIRDGRFKLVYIAPERLRNRPFNELVRELSIDLLAVDEAHCVSQWGHDFRPDYLLIADFYARLPQRPRILALTATATPDVKSDIRKQLGIPGAKMVTVGSDRPNLYVSAQRIERESDKQAALQDFLAARPGSGIIYVSTRKESEHVAAWVQSALGIPADCYHAGLTPRRRTAVQEAFIKDDIRVVAATNAFGMGIDKPDIRFVLHYNLPPTLEAYYQEIGRAGRDGLPADCRLLFSLKDKGLQEWFIANDEITRDDLNQFWRLCARHRDDRRAVVPLAALEGAGFGVTKQRLVISMLERLGALRWSDRDDECRYLEPGRRPAPEAVQAALREVDDRLAYRRNKLNTVVNWANTTHCRRERLLAYFGEKPEGSAPRCCDNCLGIKAGEMELSQDPLVVLACVKELPREVGRKKLADILRGAATADMSAHGYDRLAHYRALSGRTGKEILAMIDRLLADEYLAVQTGKYPVVVFTREGLRALEKGDPLPVPVKRGKGKAAAKGVTGTVPSDTPDEELLAALKEYRNDLVRKEGKPAYVFFHNRTLEEIARVKPGTEAELYTVKGMGEHKVTNYGEQILSIVRDVKSGR